MPRRENINDKRILSVQVIVCIVMYHCTYKEATCINMNNHDVNTIFDKNSTSTIQTEAESYFFKNVQDKGLLDLMSRFKFQNYQIEKIQ